MFSPQLRQNIIILPSDACYRNPSFRLNGLKRRTDTVLDMMACYDINCG